MKILKLSINGNEYYFDIPSHANVKKAITKESREFVKKFNECIDNAFNNVNRDAGMEGTVDVCDKSKAQSAALNVYRYYLNRSGADIDNPDIVYEQMNGKSRFDLATLVVGIEDEGTMIPILHQHGTRAFLLNESGKTIEVLW